MSSLYFFLSPWWRSRSWLAISLYWSLSCWHVSSSFDRIRRASFLLSSFCLQTMNCVTGSKGRRERKHLSLQRKDKRSWLGVFMMAHMYSWAHVSIISENSVCYSCMTLHCFIAFFMYTLTLYTPVKLLSDAFVQPNCKTHPFPNDWTINWVKITSRGFGLPEIFLA